MEPAYFFDEVLPALARERARAFPALAQRACVVVDTRAWTLDLHDAAAPVRDGADREAPFQLWLSGEAFKALVDGRVDDVVPPRVGYRGDVRVLEQLGRMLMPASSSVFVRVRR